MLVIPNKSKLLNIPLLESRVPNPEELVVISQPMLNATISIGKLLKDCSEKWAIGGDAGEILSGVNVRPDHITILATRMGCEEASKKLETFRVEGPRNMERQLERNAEIEPIPLPVRVKSSTSQFRVEGERVDVHGDLQIKVGGWDWGDPLDFEPEYVYVVGVRVPVVPLRLKTQLYMGLGWTDRVKKINQAMARRHHKIV
ncbi:MAG TPA: hypothetical protein VE955_04650 [Candidatus Dormibacteraeota bacterium]|jgi:hypothetical protein|nr:hypothetical protein [Candidatus Dormibacteraeota bacterium]